MFAPWKGMRIGRFRTLPQLIADEIYYRPLGPVALGYFVIFTIFTAGLIGKGLDMYANRDQLWETGSAKVARLVAPLQGRLRTPARWISTWLNDADILVQSNQPPIDSRGSPLAPSRRAGTSGRVQQYLDTLSSDEVDSFDRPSALSDPLARINDDFVVPQKLFSRVGFWFDVYTLYSSAHYVFHHATYPWIVFDVVDTSDLFQTRSAKWYQRTQADKRAAQRRLAVEQALTALARTGAPRRGNELQSRLYESMRSLSGPRRRVFAQARRELRMQLGQRDFFLRGLSNSYRYMPFMEQEFLNAGLPTELARIPFVESSFNERAVSKVGASGIWQIMPGTARGRMIMNEFIDERNSPLKATRFTASYLRRDHRFFDSWPLAVTAYNHGIGSLSRAVRQLGTRDLAEIIQRYRSKSFGFASENFYASFLAALHAEKYNDKIFGYVVPAALLDKVYYELPRSMRVRDLPRLLGQTEAEFLTFNLDVAQAFRFDKRLPAGFGLFVPREQRERLDIDLAITARPNRSG
jgi:membrane-bound lytic murein transglycosylase D